MEKSAEYYSINEVCDKLGVSRGIILRLCNSGLVPGVRRNRLGHRMLTEEQINHLAILIGLKQAGFRKSDLKRYVRLVRQGDQTLSERKALLETQKRQLWQELEDRQQGIDFLERQVEGIDQVLSASINSTHI